MRSKRCISALFGIFFLLLPVMINAQELLELPDSFQRGDTYIRYRLSPDALASQNLDQLSASEETILTIDRRHIDAIDAYFDLTPERLPYELTPGADRPHLFEVKWTPETYPRTFSLRAKDTASSLNTLVAWWEIGKIALTLGYDGFHPSRASLDSSETLANRLLHGQLRLPLGESGFSLGASLGMYASSVIRWAKHTFVPRQFDLGNLFDGTDASAHAAYATSAAQADSLPASTLTLIGPQQAVAGAMHVSGAVKGVDVFTEVGFASGTQDQRGEIAADELTLANFYALGGAKYRVGQVTLGLEAGFENGTDPIADGSDSLGFENDFLIDTLLEPDAVSGHSPDNKVYATVSAALNPTERMTVEGAFRYVQPFHDGKTTDMYGFEVDGAFRYSLTNYLKCLVRAGMASLSDSWENSQYKVINQIEVTY